MHQGVQNGQSRVRAVKHRPNTAGPGANARFLLGCRVGAARDEDAFREMHNGRSYRAYETLRDRLWETNNAGWVSTLNALFDHDKVGAVLEAALADPSFPDADVYCAYFLSVIDAKKAASILSSTQEQSSYAHLTRLLAEFIAHEPQMKARHEINEFRAANEVLAAHLLYAMATVNPLPGTHFGPTAAARLVPKKHDFLRHLPNEPIGHRIVLALPDTAVLDVFPLFPPKRLADVIQAGTETTTHRMIRLLAGQDPRNVVSVLDQMEPRRAAELLARQSRDLIGTLLGHEEAARSGWVGQIAIEALDSTKNYRRKLYATTFFAVIAIITLVIMVPLI